MKAILSADRKWGLGYQGRLLVSIPSDLRFFRETTMGHVVVMGRKTLATLPAGQPLKGRTNIILSRDPEWTVRGATVVHSIKELIPQLGSLRHIQPQGAHLFGLAEYLFWGAFHDHIALAHHQHAVGLSSFFHIVGDGHHRDAHVLVQMVNGLHHLLPAPGIKHGGGLVQDQAVGPHGDHARNGNALLLATGQVVGCTLPVLVDARHLHRFIHAAAHLLRRHAQIFQRKGECI